MRQNHAKNLAPSIFSRFRKSAIVAVTVIALISFSGVFAFPIMDLPTKLAGEILRLSMPTESQSAMANPHFRTAASGDWASNSTWEQSNNGGTNWIPATTTPTAANSDSIVVRLGHFVSVTSAISVDQVSINEGGVAIESGGSLTVEDGPGTDLTLANLDTTLQLEPGGMLANNGQVSVSGTFVMGGGGSISGNSLAYGASSTLAYFLGTQSTSNTEFPAVNPPTTLIISDAEVTLHAPRSVLQVALDGSGSFNIESGFTVANGGVVVRQNGTASFIGSVNYAGSVTLSYSNANVTTGTEAGVPVTHLQVQQGTITLASDVTATSSLALNFGYVITGANKLTLETGTVSSASGWVVGNFKKVFSFNAGLSQEQKFEVGTVNGYSPVSVTYSIGSSGTYEQTVKAVEGPHPILSDPTKALSRYWRLSNITGTGSASADLTFSYRNADVPVTANESSFVMQKYSNGLFTQPGGTVNVTSNSATITGISSFSDWTLAEPSAVGAQNVATEPATNIGSTTATLNGQANPSGLDTTGWFRYSTLEPETCNDVFGTRSPVSGGTSLGSGTESVPYSQMVEGLTPSTTYYFCAIAQNSAGTSFGAVLSFTPQQPNQPPVAVDDNVVATEDTQLNFPAATLLANDSDPDNDLLDIILPSPTTSQGGTVTLTVPGPLGIVTYTPPNNFTGTDTFSYVVSDGDLFDIGLVTVQVNPNIPPPTVNTTAASNVTGQTATLNGSANPNGNATTGWFRYSLSDPITCNDTFGTRTPTIGGLDVGSGTSAMPFSQGLSGLMPDATVYYCAIAQNAGGTSFGSVLSFTPQWVPPTVTTNAASSIAGTSATLNGSADPNGSSATAWFRYSATNPGTCNDAFGTRAPAAGGSNLGSGDSDAPYLQTVSGLTPATTYFYCAIAQNSGGTAFGSVLQLTTSQLNVGISVNQSSLNFGDQTLGTTGPVQGVTIVSTGSDPLVLDTVILVGDSGDFQFVQVPAAGTVLQPGESVTADFAFAPTALGLRSATLTIESNAFSSPSVELIGAGVVPDINVTPASVDFGTVSTGLGGVGQQIQISNLGTGDLVIAGAAFTGPNAADFSSSQVTEVIVIPSGQIYPITIIFNPQGIGPRSGSLDLGSNDPDEPLVSIPLSGIGVNPGFLQFSAASYSGNEGDGTIALTIQRVGGSQGAVSAFFSATGGLATGGEACGGAIDYVNQLPFANFADGDTEPKTVLVTVCDDAMVESTETFDVSLFTTNADIGANTQAIIAITDNDVAGQISISGSITDAENVPLSGRSVDLAGASTGSTSTDAGGLFTFVNVPGGSYIVKPASDPSLSFDPISRSYPTRSTNVNDANFKAYQPGTEPRTLTIVNGFATPGQQALIPIVLQSQGNEAGLTFSIAYDQALLSGATVECGSAAGAGCSLTVNTATPGQIGVSVDPVAATFAAGSREVVRVLFYTSPSASVQNTPVTFANTPAVSETSDTDANPLLTRYVSGSVIFIQGIESDVASRPNGDGIVTSVDVAQVRRFAVGLDQFDPDFNEFQRADSAPYPTAGDGVVAATDITQARRYQIGTDPTQPAGGPQGPVTGGSIFESERLALSILQASRVVRVVEASASRGSQVTVSLQVDAEGDENVYGFSLNYDPAILTDPVITIGTDAIGGNVLSNTSQLGKVGFSVDFGSSSMPAGGAKELVKVRFNVSPTATAGQTPLVFADAPAFRETSNASAQALDTSYANGFVTILAPTAAGASISGRVLTSNGTPIRGALVTVLDANGTARTYTTSTFGHYRFDDLPAGQVYIVSVSSRRYQFATPTMVVDLSDNVADLDFVGTP